VNVAILERKFSFRSEYDISAGADTYYAEKKLLSFLANLQVVGENRQSLANIRQRFALIHPKYEFLLARGAICRFWCEKAWKGVFQCAGNQESYRLYRHKGVNYSIFQNDRQIASFSKNKVVVGKGNEYQVRINRDANALVVICMVLSMNTSQDDDKHTTVTYDFGNIGPEAQPFDTSWEPS
jgi:uncharacterized protein YxjI